MAIVGPTGVGKTDLAEELAASLGGEIISADAMQVYRGMDIGTAKPPPAARRALYHCLDLVDPGEPYSAALFQRDARRAIEECMAKGVTPIVCGGTGLYVRAALDDFEFPAGDQVDNPHRAHYEHLADERGAVALHRILAERDPESAALVHPNNVRRVIRALELADEGVSYAAQSAGFATRRSVYDTRWIGLDTDRGELYRRIDARVDAMIEAGLLAEVERLLLGGFRDALTAAQAIGYKEFVPVLEGAVELSIAVDAVKTATRRYAKRQLTWFRADPRVTWIDVTGLTPAERLTRATDALLWSQPNSEGTAFA